jgi:uncharacterized membrane protein YtjA (UPF0391 family)
MTLAAEDIPMLYYALMFLVVGLVAGALGLFGIAAIAGQIAWVLFLIGVVLIIVHMISGRRALPLRRRRPCPHLLAEGCNTLPLTSPQESDSIHTVSWRWRGQRRAH